VLTKSHHWSLSGTKHIQRSTLHSISLRADLILPSNTKFYFRVDKITPLVPIRNQTHPVLNLTFLFFKSYFLIWLHPSMLMFYKRFFLWISSPKSCRHFSHPTMNNSCRTHITKGIKHFPAVFEIMLTLDTEVSDAANFTYIWKYKPVNSVTYSSACGLK